MKVPPFLVDLITNLCIPFTLPLALQTRQFTKRQLRSQEVNAKGVLSVRIHARKKTSNKVSGIPHAELISKANRLALILTSRSLI